MAKMSQTVKEILQVVVFLSVVGSLMTVFVIYPLNRTKAILARPDIEDFNPDSLPANDPAAFMELSAAIDTFRVDADGLTNLACVYLTPPADSATSDSTPQFNGTAVLLHDERFDRTSMTGMAREFLDAGFTVCLYDQRACGLSTGKYHSDGELEAADLTELIAYLAIRDRAHRPLVAIGQAAGADAAILAAAETGRFDGLVAIEPYVTSERWLDILIADHDMHWIPFRHTILEFWYELRSGYAPQYRGPDDLEGIGCAALLLASEDHLAEEEITRLVELSDAGNLQTKPLADDPTELTDQIMQFVTSLNSPEGE